MPTAEVEALEIATTEATGVDGAIDEDRRYAVYKAEYERRIAERRARLMSDMRQASRAMDGWARVESYEAWQAMVEKTAADLESSNFLIDRLGGERYIDPQMVAVLLVLRRRLIDEYGAESAADIMLIDMAMISYYHTLRINGWIGNFQAQIEAEMFGTEGLSVVVQGKQKSPWEVEIKGLRVISLLDRVGEQLLPLMDRANRMMLRNLKALESRRQPAAPSVSNGQAGQVNVGAVQTNQTGRPVKDAEKDAGDA